MTQTINELEFIKLMEQGDYKEALASLERIDDIGFLEQNNKALILDIFTLPEKDIALLLLEKGLKASSLDDYGFNESEIKSILHYDYGFLVTCGSLSFPGKDLTNFFKKINCIKDSCFKELLSPLLFGEFCDIVGELIEKNAFELPLNDYLLYRSLCSKDKSSEIMAKLAKSISSKFMKDLEKVDATVAELEKNIANSYENIASEEEGDNSLKNIKKHKDDIDHANAAIRHEKHKAKDYFAPAALSFAVAIAKNRTEEAKYIINGIKSFKRLLEKNVKINIDSIFETGCIELIISNKNSDLLDIYLSNREFIFSSWDKYAIEEKIYYPASLFREFGKLNPNELMDTAKVMLKNNLNPLNAGVENSAEDTILKLLIKAAGDNYKEVVYFAAEFCSYIFINKLINEIKIFKGLDEIDFHSDFGVGLLLKASSDARATALIDHYKSMDFKGEGAEKFVEKCAENDWSHALKKSIDKGLNINSMDFNQVRSSFLTLAIESGSDRVAKILIENDNNFRFTNNLDKYHLEHAAINGRYSIVEELLLKLESSKIPPLEKQKQLDMALAASSYNLNFPIRKLLIEKGANPSVEIRGSNTSDQILNATIKGLDVENLSPEEKKSLYLEEFQDYLKNLDNSKNDTSNSARNDEILNFSLEELGLVEVELMGNI